MLIHLNLNRSASPVPPEVPQHHQTGSYVPPEVPQHMTASGNRVQFVDPAPTSEGELPPPSYDAVEEDDRTNTIGERATVCVHRCLGGCTL